MNILLFDTPAMRDALQPFSAIRPIGMFAWGIYTLVEKWQHHLTGTYSFATAPYLATKFPSQVEAKNLCINGSITPSVALVEAILALSDNQVLMQADKVLAFWAHRSLAQDLYLSGWGPVAEREPVEWEGPLLQLTQVWDLFVGNEAAIRQDMTYASRQYPSVGITDRHTICYNPAAIFIGQGATIRAAVLNAEKGPIYIGEEAVIEEQAVIKGPVAIGKGAQVKVHACITGGTTIGPYAKVGGEVYNSVVGSYSNKAHAGFLGNAVIGSWCNMGALTSNSNLRNDYATVSIWNMAHHRVDKTGLQFCGLFLGDYSRCGIHTMFNTATVVGVAAQVFGADFFDRFIPPFAKGYPPNNFTPQPLACIIDSINAMMVRRNQLLSAEDKAILAYLYQAYTHNHPG